MGDVMSGKVVVLLFIFIAGEKMKSKQKYLAIIPVLILYIALINSSCSEDNPVVPPPPVEPKVIFLKLVTVSCTEAFITITANDTLLPVNITLNKDDTAFFNFTLSNKDTTVIDTTLQPNTTYIYQATADINGETKKSDTLQVKTLNTTSHNFTWQTFTFGEPSAGSSVLNDVAIIDENNIWAVGEIYMNDSLGNPDPTRYNLVVWDGNNWTIKRVPYYYQGQPFYNPIQTVFAFGPNDIWFGGNGVIHWDGNQYNPVPIPSDVWGPHQINKIWGISSNDLFIVGNDGKIAHYQNSNWSSIESGTITNLVDIFGAIEPISGILKILTTISGVNNYKILSVTPSSANDTLDWQTNKSLGGVWLDGLRTYASGTEIWKNENNSWKQLTTTGYFFTRVRGTKYNNIYGIGPDGTVHFNGSSWQIIKPRPEGLVIVAGDCSNNMIVMVGFASSGGVVGKAAVMIGTQIK